MGIQEGGDIGWGGSGDPVGWEGWDGLEGWEGWEGLERGWACEDRALLHVDLVSLGRLMEQELLERHDGRQHSFRPLANPAIACCGQLVLPIDPPTDAHRAVQPNPLAHLEPRPELLFPFYLAERGGGMGREVGMGRERA